MFFINYINIPASFKTAPQTLQMLQGAVSFILHTYSHNTSDNRHWSHYPSTPDYPSTTELFFQYPPQTEDLAPSPTPFEVWLNQLHNANRDRHGR